MAQQPFVQPADNIIRGEDIEFQIDTHIGDLELMVLRMHGDKIIQVDADTGEQLSAALALNRAICLAEWMKTQGIKTGDTISVNSENRLEFVIVPYACYIIGAVFAPLNPEYTDREIDHVIKLSKPKMVFCSNKTVKLMGKVKNENRNIIQKLILFGNKRYNKDDLIMYEDIIKGIKAEPIDEDYEALPYDPTEVPATILMSSGTTGLPKGVVCTHANMTAFIEIARTRVAEVMESSGDIVTLGLTPFFHSMGFMSMFMNSLAGNLVVVMNSFKAKHFFETIQKYKVTNLIVPPPIILILLKHPAAKNYDLSSLKDVRSGAAPMGQEMEHEVKQRFKLHHVSQSYGMTETTLGVLMSTVTNYRVGSVGQIVTGMACKVIDENGNALGPNKEGEICFNGPLVMKGYVNDPVSTRNTIDADGWLHTGDIAYYDKDGYFYIVDRIKELIKYKAFQVAPAELEALLQNHPAVGDAAVIGLPDPEAGELPLAFIVKKQGVNVTEKEIQDYIAGKVSRQKKLRGGVVFIEEIPKNPSGKILRRVLKERAKALKSKSKL